MRTSFPRERTAFTCGKPGEWIHVWRKRFMDSLSFLPWFCRTQLTISASNKALE